MEVKMIKLDEIEQNENSRVVYKPADLAELVASIRMHGLLQPPGVVALASGKWEAVYGNRRIVACKKLGWSEIPCVITKPENDIDRDIMGLVENFKRQNTSISEDARMFQSLKDLGMSETEIAARLDIPALRVTSALELTAEVSPEIMKKIHHRAPGYTKRSMKDHISASIAVSILNIRKKESLNRAQMREIFNYAATSTPTLSQIQKIGPLVRGGASVAEAIERVASLRRIMIDVYVKEAKIGKLENKYEKSIQKIFLERLMADKELGVIDMASSMGNATKRPMTRKERVELGTGDAL